MQPCSKLKIMLFTVLFFAVNALSNVDFYYTGPDGTRKILTNEMISQYISQRLSQRFDLPSASFRLANPDNKFTPVYGHVVNVQHIHCSYGSNDVIIAWNPSDNLVFDHVQDSTWEPFQAWAQSIWDRDSALSSRAPEMTQKTYNLFYKQNILALDEIEIEVESYYDYDTKKWIHVPPEASGKTTKIRMLTKKGYFFHQEKDSSVVLRKYETYIPPNSKNRIFFGSGYTPIIHNIKEVSLDSIKVIPYKIKANMPDNKNIGYRLELRKALENNDYSAIPEILRKIDEYEYKKPDWIYENAIHFEDWQRLGILAGVYSDTTRHSRYDLVNYQDSLDGIIRSTFNKYVQSEKFEKDVQKEKDPFNRALARILAHHLSTAKPRYTYDFKNEQSNIVEAHLDSIPDETQRKYLIRTYYSRDIMDPSYIYGGGFLGVTNYFGKLGDYAQPGPGFGGALGFGNNNWSLDVFAQFFTSALRGKASESRKLKGLNLDEYEFDALDLFINGTYKWLVTSRFEGGVYIGPSFNITRVIHKSPYDKDNETDMQHMPVDEKALGLDAGLSFCLFNPFGKRQIEGFKTFAFKNFGTGRINGRLRIGISSQYAEETFNTTSLKGYITLEAGFRWHVFGITTENEPPN